jgi:hypothetical protein
MRYIGFDNMIKVSKKEVVKDMPRIIKPSNSFVSTTNMERRKK